MSTTTLLKILTTTVVGLSLLASLGCSQSSSISWMTLNNVTDATALQKAIGLKGEDVSLVVVGLRYYRELLKERDIENQDRATTLFKRIELYSENNKMLLADDFNGLAELELLHLSWSKSATIPYAQVMSNRIRAFDASAAVFRTLPLMRPTEYHASGSQTIYYRTFEHALVLLNDLCVVANNPWSLDPESGVAPDLVKRVQSMSENVVGHMQNVNIDVGTRNAPSIPFSKSSYAREFSNMCRPIAKNMANKE